MIPPWVYLAIVVVVVIGLGVFVFFSVRWKERIEAENEERIVQKAVDRMKDQQP